MRAKPEMKPWGSTDKSKMSSFRSGTNRVSIGVLGLCRPYGAQKNGYQCLTQGLRPGLGRSIALTGLIYVFSINILYNFVDALALTTKLWVWVLRNLLLHLPLYKYSVLQYLVA